MRISLSFVIWRTCFNHYTAPKMSHSSNDSLRFISDYLRQHHINNDNDKRPKARNVQKKAKKKTLRIILIFGFLYV